MKRDIEFRELIKIISEIENKNKEIVVKNDERIVYTKEYIETKFNEDIPLEEKTILSKMSEMEIEETLNAEDDSSCYVYKEKLVKTRIKQLGKQYRPVIMVEKQGF